MCKATRHTVLGKKTTARQQGRQRAAEHQITMYKAGWIPFHYYGFLPYSWDIQGTQYGSEFILQHV
jgi:hypothetical protein